MKIYVIGSCQSVSIARCLAAMSLGVPVERFGPRTDLSAFVTSEDVVFRQRESFAMTSAQTPPNETVYPRIWFNAFHPDVAYLAEGSEATQAPLGAENASLVLYAWHRGMSIADTLRLFCEPVYERLGFFDCWNVAKRALFEEGDVVGFPLDAIFSRLERSGCFMRTPAHPSLFVAAEIARELARRAALPIFMDTPEAFIDDPMLQTVVWPVYPEIAQRLGVPGAYAFKPAQPPSARPELLDLDEFVARSFAAYQASPADALACKRLEHPAYRELESIVADERRHPRGGAVRDAARARRLPAESPYANLPAERFWRRAVEGVPARDVDPVGNPPFRIGRRDRVATAGSCFAQHMSRVLARSGYTYFVAEPPSDDVSGSEAERLGYGAFSTRSGNVYTARQLLQLFDRAYGTFAPIDETWLRTDGRYADPFRPLIEPDGFATAAAVIRSRDRHLAAVRTMFEQLDVFVFTLGLTEAWRSTVDGAVFPLAPGVAARCMDASRYEFVNFSAADVSADLEAFLQRLTGVNPAARVVLTVSPVPLIATYEPRHVLVSTTYSKAALRVAADETERAHAAVWYFPSYELVAGSFNRGAYYEPDLRNITPAGVEHVMRLFLSHCAADEAGPSYDAEALMLEEHRANVDIVCDEESIAAQATGDVTGVRGDPAGAPSQWPEYGWFRRVSPHAHLPATPVAPPPTGMEALDPAAMRGRVRAKLPDEMRAGTIVTVACTVTNDGPASFESAGKHPVFMCYRWYDSTGTPAEVGRSLHTELPGELAAGKTASLSMRIAAPLFGGRYRLRVALLQSAGRMVRRHRSQQWRRRNCRRVPENRGRIAGLQRRPSMTAAFAPTFPWDGRCWCGAMSLPAPFTGDYARCAACETLVSTVPPAVRGERVIDDSTDFYGVQYWTRYQTDQRGLPPIAERSRGDLSERCIHWLRALLTYRRPPARMLEIGAAHGGFLRLAQLAGFDATGIEMSPSIVDFARRTFDVDMRLGPLEAAGFADATFDIVVAFDVLEHVRDPGAMLREIRRVLRPEGIVLVQTPQYPGRDAHQLVAARDPFLVHLCAPEHLYLFSAPALEKILALTGFPSATFLPAIFAYDMFAVASARSSRARPA